MLMGLADLHGTFTGTFYMNRTGPDSFESLNSKEAVVSFFQKCVAWGIVGLPLSHLLFSFPRLRRPCPLSLSASLPPCLSLNSKEAVVSCFQKCVVWGIVGLLLSLPLFFSTLSSKLIT